MAVLTITPRAFGARGTGKQNIGASGEEAVPAVSYTATYRAHCDSASDTPPVIYKFLYENKGSYPWYGSPLTLGNGSDKTVVVKTIDVETIDGSDRDFDVVFGYEPAKSDSDIQSQPGIDGEETTNPLDWLDEIEVTFTQTLVVAEFGVFHGFASSRGPVNNAKMAIGETLVISNSARVPYDPPIEKEKDIKVIRISRNVAQYDEAFFNQFHGVVNRDLVTIVKPDYGFRSVIQPFTGKIKVIGATFQTQNGIRYWRQTIEVHVDEDGWRRKILDRGMATRREASDPDGSGGTLSNTDEVSDGKANLALNTDPAGYPLTEPVCLDGNGKPLRSASYPAVYGEWGVYRELDIGIFQLF